MDCPRCALVNPPTAQRCDCGYDFLSRKVETPYCPQALPTTVKGYLALVGVVNVILGIMAILSKDAYWASVDILYAIAVYLLYRELLKRKKYARIGLALFTFPIGTLLLFTREMKVYMLQRN